MIRVLNIISDTNIGGAGRVILNYLAYADQGEFETHVALPKKSLLIPLLEDTCAKLHPVDGIADRSYDKRDVPPLINLIRQIKPDLVHTHGALSGRIAARRCKVPVVYSRHSAFPVPAKLRYPPGRWVNKFINEHYADRIIAVSPATAQNLTDGGISPKKITVVLNGVAPLTPIPQDQQQALRQSLGLGPKDFTLGIMARIEDYKGHLTIAQAVKQLKDAGRRVKVLVGGTGDFLSQLTQTVHDLGIQNEMLLLGFRPDVPALLSILSCQLNASYGTEATSLALLEGMSLGLASIVSDYGGNPYLVADGENGLIFPAKNAQALAGCITKLMDDPSLCAQLGTQAKETFSQRFTGEVFARNTERVYRDVLKGVSS